MTPSACATLSLAALLATACASSRPPLVVACPPLPTAPAELMQPPQGLSLVPQDLRPVPTTDSGSAPRKTR